eukprot:scaffold247538_cov32-Tisochrysis_lutea.AAC.2
MTASLLGWAELMLRKASHQGPLEVVGAADSPDREGRTRQGPKWTQLTPIILEPTIRATQQILPLLQMVN